MLGIVPKTGKLISEKPAQQAKRALSNLKLLATKNGFKLQHAIKCNLYLTNMADFVEVNQVYAEFFKEDLPARTTVAVQALPLGANFEIEAVFFKP